MPQTAVPHLSIVDVTAPWEPSAHLVAALASFERLVDQIDGAHIKGRTIIDLVTPTETPDLGAADLGAAELAAA